MLLLVNLYLKLLFLVHNNTVRYQDKDLDYDNLKICAIFQNINIRRQSLFKKVEI
jgi:hypothetical protein